MPLKKKWLNKYICNQVHEQSLATLCVCPGTMPSWFSIMVRPSIQKYRISKPKPVNIFVILLRPFRHTIRHCFRIHNGCIF